MAKSKKRAAEATSARKREGYIQLDVIPPRCPNCGCTDREPYFAIRKMAISGVTPAGQPYTRITIKRTRCKSCGQSRDDRLYESPAEAAA